MNWKTMYAYTAAFSFVAVTCQLSAYDDNDAMLRNLENRVCSLEACRIPCGIVNPSARPTQICDWGAYVVVSPLLLKPQENGLEFAVKTEDVGQGSGAISSLFIAGRTKAKGLEFNWDWGFRLGLGLSLEHDGWDVFLDWTRLHTDAHRTIHPNIGELLIPTWPAPSSNFTATNINKSVYAHQSGNSTSIKSDWRLHLNELDLELGREFFVSKWLVVKPHGGLRTAWIRQRDKISHALVLNPSTTLTYSYSEADVVMKCNYWGIGLLGGFDTQWGFGSGWSIFGSFDASILYGYFHIDHDERGTVGAVPAASPFIVGQTIDIITLDDFYHVGRVITDMFIGLRYDYLFCDERYHLSFEAGWEHHMFFGQNQFIKFVDDVAPGTITANQGDLTLQGFFATVRFDF